MKLSTKRSIVIGFRAGAALTEFGFAVWLQTCLHNAHEEGILLLVIIIGAVVLSALYGMWFLVQMIDEVGNLFADKVSDQIVTIQEEKSLFGREEFEEQIEDEEEDDEIITELVEATL